MAVELITGAAEGAHISSNDAAAFSAAIYGQGIYVLDYADKLAATVVTNNDISLAPGEVLWQGRHIRMTESESVVIENGSAGMMRNDLIVMRYTRDTSTGYESCGIAVIKGAPSTTPVDPSYVTANIFTGAPLAEVPLYRVKLDGITVAGIVRLVADAKTLTDIMLGPIPVARGGTGAATVALARNALGLGNTSGAVPIANGGTGQSTAALARNALGLGNTAGALPIANGGTGATAATAARANLGLGNLATINAPLGLDIGGTGATSAASARANIGAQAILNRTVRPNLSSETASTDTGGNITPGITGTLPIAHGGTGATTAAAALTKLGVTAELTALNQQVASLVQRVTRLENK
jgi:hypothetical protein